MTQFLQSILHEQRNWRWRGTYKKKRSETYQPITMDKTHLDCDPNKLYMFKKQNL